MKLMNFLCAPKQRNLTKCRAKDRGRFRPSVELLEDRMAPAIFTVTSAADLVIPGTLRTAILDANASPGADTINFNITAGPAVKTITLFSALPTLTGPVTIAGDTQPGFVAGNPRIELNGLIAGAGVNGLVMKAAGCVVRSLIINNFGGNGILALGSNGVVEGCFIGIDSTGDVAQPNQLHGVLIAGTATGVRIGGVTQAALNVISANSLSGVAILGAFTKNNKVQGNIIGLNNTGGVDLGNGLDGVLISGGAKSNLIGGAVAGAGNLISGNNSNGIKISGPGTTGNLVLGNFIGLNLGNNADRGNSANGVEISGGAANNLVGGTVAGAANRINANDSNGVSITGAGTIGNKVQGNLIGLAIANTGVGVFILGAAKNTVGGTVAGARNIISGNGSAGVELQGAGATGNLVQGNFIGTDTLGTAALGNGGSGILIRADAAKNTVGGTVPGARNVISGNGNHGVQIFNPDTNGNKVQGNFIGTDVTGTIDLGNTDDGVNIGNNASNNTIGGLVAGARNIISGNNSDGVEIRPGSAGNLVQGNFIGTDVTGTLDRGNSANGVNLTGATNNNTVGGTVTAARNIISGNGNNGVIIDGAAANLNQVKGNFIGTNAAGTAALGNSLDGVRIINGAAFNTVGGIVAGARNVISGNGVNGVTIAGGATETNVQGNFIGTNAAGNASLPNAADGVRISFGAPFNVVGGNMAGARNVISGNNRFGLLLQDPGTDSNQILGNFVGVAANGVTALGNASHGVFITANAADNRIGSPLPGGGNTIANNVGDGVLIGSDPGLGFNIPSGSGNSVLRNRIFANAGQGIDLGANDGPTVNDPNDPDAGPNELLNTPTLSSVFLSGANLLITGLIDTQAGKTLRMEFFASPTGSQGQTFLGFQNVSMSGANTVIFTSTLTVPASVLKGHKLTATITDELGNTSEFSLAATIE